MRTFNTLIALAALAACHRMAERRPTDAGDKINCAIGSNASLAPGCTAERTVTAQGLILTIHHPDGGFRRLLITHDGRGVVAADGAVAATVVPLNAREIEVGIENDRYRLPATVKLRQ